MKHNYLYQGWAGNTYSHKCKNTNEKDDDILSGGSTEDTSNIEYLDVSGLDISDINSKNAALPNYAISVKLKKQGYVAFTPSSMYESAVTTGADILAVAIDWSLPTNAFGSDVVTTNDYILMLPPSLGFSQSELDAIPRITKEEFYSLETIAPSGNKFTLIVDDPTSGQKSITYTYKEGQTWEDWIASENNIGGLTIQDVSDFGYSLNIRGGVITEMLGSNGAIVYNAENRTNPANPTDVIGTKIYYCYGPEL